MRLGYLHRGNSLNFNLFQLHVSFGVEYRIGLKEHLQQNVDLVKTNNNWLNVSFGIEYRFGLEEHLQQKCGLGEKEE